MYNLKHLFGIARSGLSDMLPAVRQAFNDDTNDDNLDEVFGANPRYRILGLIVAGILVGELIKWMFQAVLVVNYIINEYVNWSAVVIGMAFALLFRRYLFESGHAKEGDFPWLAASLIPAAVLIAVIAFFRQFFDGSLDLIGSAPVWAGFGAVLLACVNALGVVAALTIAVAALCFSKDWPKALVLTAWGTANMRTGGDDIAQAIFRIGTEFGQFRNASLHTQMDQPFNFDVNSIADQSVLAEIRAQSSRFTAVTTVQGRQGGEF